MDTDFGDSYQEKMAEKEEIDNMKELERLQREESDRQSRLEWAQTHKRLERNDSVDSLGKIRSGQEHRAFLREYETTKRLQEKAEVRRIASQH